MSRPAPYTSWRFVLGGPDSAIPGLQVGPTGAAVTVEGGAAVAQAIRLILMTVPGERVMRPEYGCHIHRLIFAPNDDTTAGLAIHYVKQALRRWEPRIDVLDVDALTPEDDPSRLDIVINYRLKATQEIQSLAYPFLLEGASS